jgi:hypothetical protein
VDINRENIKEINKRKAETKTEVLTNLEVDHVHSIRTIDKTNVDQVQTKTYKDLAMTRTVEALVAIGIIEVLTVTEIYVQATHPDITINKAIRVKDLVQ